MSDLIMIFPFRIPFFIPLWLHYGIRATLSALRLTPPRQRSDDLTTPGPSSPHPRGSWRRKFVKLNLPMNMVTAPLIADLFLFSIRAIGREEVHDGTVGADNIVPLDIMAFFLTLAYIALSIDASGLVKYLAFKVLQKGGKNGHRLFFYLYCFFFALGTFIGNDPIILSGPPFLAYMTRVSSNIADPRAWIHSQFAIANICSAILVSSNPTNLVLAGAFSIKFISYTANMIVPVVVTAIVLFPILLYIIFRKEKLIPREIKMHQLSDAQKAKKPVNPNVPYARGALDEEEEDGVDGTDKAESLSLEEIMNPFLDKGGTSFGAFIMGVTLVTVLALNAASQSGQERPIFYVTLPAAFAMFVWDLVFGWIHRHETRELARKGREEVRKAREERAVAGVLDPQQRPIPLESIEASIGRTHSPASQNLPPSPKDETGCSSPAIIVHEPNNSSSSATQGRVVSDGASRDRLGGTETSGEKPSHSMKKAPDGINQTYSIWTNDTPSGEFRRVRFKKQEARTPEQDVGILNTSYNGPECRQQYFQRTTLSSLSSEIYIWFQETFPTAAVVLTNLPWALIPFALSMFVLVQALVTKGWVQVFAYGWNHWVDLTGIVGAIGGMAFLSVVLCNVSRRHPLSWDHLSCLPIYHIANKPNPLVCGYQHRHHDPTVARNPGLDRDSGGGWLCSDQRPDVLGHGVQHGAWCKLWRVQYGIQRVACRSLVARHPATQAHPRVEPQIRALQLAHHLRRDDEWPCRPDRRDLYHAQ